VIGVIEDSDELFALHVAEADPILLTAGPGDGEGHFPLS
jgi:hypothetical protein